MTDRISVLTGDLIEKTLGPDLSIAARLAKMVYSIFPDCFFIWPVGIPKF